MEMIDIKENYINKNKNYTSCRICFDKDENLQHLIDCTVYNFDPQRDTDVSQIFSQITLT